MIRANSFTFNGEYFEDIITGYETINSSGRESIGFEQQTESADSIDGLVYKGKRLTERTISIDFIIKGTDSADVRSKVDALVGCLQTEKAKLIFYDESDKYYIGTVSASPTIAIYQRGASGSFVFVCADPFKYSVNEYTATAVVGDDGLPIFEINYDGTALSRPTLEAVLNTESGFLGWADGNNNLIQLGDYDEEDGIVREKDVMYLNTPTTQAWSTWGDNNAVIQSGAQTGTASKGTNLTVSNYGSGTGWHGPSVTADVTENLITNGKCSFKYRFQNPNSTTGKKQGGLMTFIAMGGTSGAKAKICEVQLRIFSGSHLGYVYIYVAGKLVKTIKNYASNASNAYTNGTVTIEKFAGKINVSVGGKTYSFNNTSLETATINFTGCYIAKYKTTAVPSSYATVYSTSVIKHNVEWWDEIENKFQPADVVEVDTSKAEVYVNGILENRLGAIGNDWGKFGLCNGTNVIVCDASSWTETMPMFTMKYRKVWI